MLVEKIMSRNVVTLRPDHTLAEAVRIFAENNIGGAPVIDDDEKMVGILTDANVFKNLRVKYKKYNITFPEGIGMTTVAFKSKVKYKDIKKAFKDLAKTLVREIMVKKVVTAKPRNTVEMAVQVLLDKRINRLPVVSRNKVVGILSRGDIIRALMIK